MDRQTHSLAIHRDSNVSNVSFSRTQHNLLASPFGSSSAEERTFHFASPSNVPSHPYALDPERVAQSLNKRERSPDAVSRVSTTSSLAAAGPQLRKKPKSISIKHNHPRKGSHVLNTSTVPTPQSTSSEQPKLFNTGSNPANSSKPVLRTDSNSSQQHSPQNRRAPASHSSYGVETTCGPPPSYSTQRTISQERIKKVERNTVLRMPSAHELVPLPNVHDSKEVNTPIDTVQKQSSVVSLIHSSPDTADTQSVPTPTETDVMANVGIRTDREYGGEGGLEDNRGSSSDERKSEDLFLNIAKVDAARATAPKPEKRRSRISLPFLSASRSVRDIKSSPTHPPQTEPQRYFNKRSSLGGHVPRALSRANLQDVSQSREHSVDPSSDAEQYGQMPGQQSFDANTENARLSQRTSQALRNTRLASESTYTPRLVEHFATESTVSTTAPSTVWDELDDLKSRIRKLELTGKLPPSSAAAMSTIERPRTATTAATTMSTSPKHRHGAPALQSTMEGIPPDVHPLLHEALGHAKQVLNNDVYQKLHATAQDALQLAAMMDNGSHDGTTHFASPSTERQIRRRTESMCRGLTELAIALSTDTKAVSARPTSRDTSHPPNAMLRSRRYSNDQGERNTSSRVESRLASRRTSVQLNQNTMGPSPSDTASRVSPTGLSHLSNTRLNRTSTLGHRRRGFGLDGAEDEADISPSIRPASRAMTDLGAYRRASGHHTNLSREYTSQHPMPTRVDPYTGQGAPLPTSVGANITTRRKYASPASTIGNAQDSSPITPRDGPLSREAFGRISIVPGENASPNVVSEAHGSGRISSSRGSLGFASRIGTSVGSRLRAVRAERSARESVDSRALKEMSPSMGRGDEHAGHLMDNNDGMQDGVA